MYESPIQVWLDKMRTEFDNETMRAVQKYDIQVDKNELIKALQYDRDQYDKGYRDGFTEGYAEAIKDIKAAFNKEFDQAVLEGFR